MNKELRKRLEEAAEDYASKVWTNPMFLQEFNECKRDFITGAEYGYKEAIAMAKEWLKDLCDRIGFTGMTIKQTADAFESDMNKLWEDKGNA